MYSESPTRAIKDQIVLKILRVLDSPSSQIPALAALNIRYLIARLGQEIKD